MHAASGQPSAQYYQERVIQLLPNDALHLMNMIFASCWLTFGQGLRCEWSRNQGWDTGDMKFFNRVIIVAVLALIGAFGFSYINNPDMPPTAHASAVGFAVANPLSGKAWRGLACPHRSAVTELVTKSLAPKLCGGTTDGGATKRAERFRTEGPVSCWALFDALSQASEARFASVIAGEEKAGPAAADICRRANELIKK